MSMDDEEDSFDRSRKNANADKNLFPRIKKRGVLPKMTRPKKKKNRFLVPDDETMFVEELDEMLIEEEPEETTVFGRDIFNNEYLTFEPSMNIPTPVSMCLVQATRL